MLLLWWISQQNNFTMAKKSKPSEKSWQGSKPFSRSFVFSLTTLLAPPDHRRPPEPPPESLRLWHRDGEPILQPNWRSGGSFGAVGPSPGLEALRSYAPLTASPTRSPSCSYQSLAKRLKVRYFVCILAVKLAPLVGPLSLVKREAFACFSSSQSLSMTPSAFLPHQPFLFSPSSCTTPDLTDAAVNKKAKSLALMPNQPAAQLPYISRVARLLDKV